MLVSYSCLSQKYMTGISAHCSVLRHVLNRVISRMRKWNYIRVMWRIKMEVSELMVIFSMGFKRIFLRAHMTIEFCAVLLDCTFYQ